MPPPRFSQRIHAQLLLCFPTQGRRIVFLFDSSPPQCIPIHLSPGPYIALCCPDHCRPPCSSDRYPSMPCVASAVPCESMPCPCLTKQCQASAQPCRSPLCPHSSLQFLTSPWPRGALQSFTLPWPCPGLALAVRLSAVRHPAPAIRIVAVPIRAVPYRYCPNLGCSVLRHYQPDQCSAPAPLCISEQCVTPARHSVTLLCHCKPIHITATASQPRSTRCACRSRHCIAMDCSGCSTRSVALTTPLLSTPHIAPADLSRALLYCRLSLHIVAYHC